MGGGSSDFRTDFFFYNVFRRQVFFRIRVSDCFGLFMYILNKRSPGQIS